MAPNIEHPADKEKVGEDEKNSIPETQQQDNEHQRKHDTSMDTKAAIELGVVKTESAKQDNYRKIPNYP